MFTHSYQVGDGTGNVFAPKLFFMDVEKNNKFRPFGGQLKVLILVTKVTY